MSMTAAENEYRLMQSIAPAPSWQTLVWYPSSSSNWESARVTEGLSSTSRMRGRSGDRAPSPAAVGLSAVLPCIQDLLYSTSHRAGNGDNLNARKLQQG